MVHLVTGYAGMEHITSADQGSFNASFFGTGQYVMEAGKQVSAAIIDNNTVRIYDGDMLMHGRHIRIPPDNYEDMTIKTGAAGKNRIDLICMTYEMDTSDGTEKAYLEVVNGEETEGKPEVPGHIYGNILDGAERNQMPLYKVVISGVVLSDITCLFKTIPTYKTLAELCAKEFRESCENYLGALGVIDTMDGIRTNEEDMQLAGALALKEYDEAISEILGKKDISQIGDGTVKGALNALNTGIKTNSWYDISTPITNTAGYPVKSADGQILTADGANGCYKITIVTAHADRTGITSTYIATAYQGVWCIVDEITVGTDSRAPRLKVVAGGTQIAIYLANTASSDDVHVFYRVDTIYRVG